MGYLWLIEPIARLLIRSLPSNFEIDDLIQVGRLALLECCGRHDANPEGFAAYAKFRVRGAMLDYVRANWSPAAVPEAEALASRNSGGCRNDDAIAVCQAIERLPEPEKRVVTLGFDKTQREIAAELRVSQARVSQIRARAVDRLRLVMLAA
jgi:RNA polymerase sigma factor (sigma-70 family)